MDEASFNPTEDDLLKKAADSAQNAKEVLIEKHDKLRESLGQFSLPFISEDIHTLDAIKLPVLATLAGLSAKATVRAVKDEARAFYEKNITLFDAREKMANQLYVRGHATVDEILEASYGEWPPKGLDLVRSNDQRVIFTPMPDDLKPTDFGGAAAGRATLDAEREIWINEDFYPRKQGMGMNSTIGHEVVHSLQGDHSYRADEVFGPGSFREISTRQGVLRSNVEAGKLYNRFPLSSSASDKVKYLSEGVEIQARIHEVLINGYQDWGRLPLNHEELVVALSDRGVEVPEDVIRNLEGSSTIDDTRRIFSSRGDIPSASSDLNYLQRHLPLEGRVALWDETLPAIYSDLIEMYGDGPGRARFGLGNNRYAEIRRELDLVNGDYKALSHVKKSETWLLRLDQDIEQGYAAQWLEQYKNITAEIPDNIPESIFRNGHPDNVVIEKLRALDLPDPNAAIPPENTAALNRQKISRALVELAERQRMRMTARASRLDASGGSEGAKADASGGISRNADPVADNMARHTDETLDTVKHTDTASDAGRHITASADEVADAAKHIDSIGDSAKTFRGGFLVEAGIGVAVGAGVIAFTDASVSDGGRIAFETAVPFGAVATSLKAGDTQLAVKEGMIETAGLGGAIAGAAAGAAIGSVVPVVGTAIGGVAGGVIGGVAGGVGLGMGTSVLLDKTNIDEAVHDGIVATVDFAGDAGATIKAGASRALYAISEMAEDLRDGFSAAAAEGQEMLASASKNLSQRAGRAMPATKTTLGSGVTVTRETAEAFTQNVRESISGGLSRVAGFFYRDEPEHELTQQKLPQEELREKLASVSIEDVAEMSPEMQALYNLRDHPKFDEVYAEFEETGSIDHIQQDMAHLNRLAQENTVLPGQRDPDQLAQQNIETPRIG